MDEQWQADLCDMQSLRSHNDGYNYILTVIDVLSTYAWAVALKNKTSTSVIEAFKTIFNEGRVPEKLQTDDGTEFLNRAFQAFLKSKGIHHFVTRSELKASIVERFNRTLKTWMWRWFTHKETRRYIDVLPKLMHNYNHSYHRSIRRAPAEVTLRNAQDVWHVLYKTQKKTQTKKPKFNVGDQVRISRVKHVFEKGYLPNWTEEVFTIAQRLRTRTPYAYRLREYDGTLLEGHFYEQELQHVSMNEQRDMFRIDRVIKTRGQGRHEEYLVHWRGWPDKYNSWVLARDVHKIT